MKSDGELLRVFAESGNEEAFTALVRRHVDLVYSAALRQVGRDAHLAHDVAQIVFTGLARKAATLADRPSLAGWLYTSTHYAAANTVRAERRRRIHEQESHMMQELRSESGVAVDWDRLRPVLDAAMLELSERDREIVVQRFFGGRSFADIGATLRLTEDTARKRAERALDKLHALLGRRGIRSTSGALVLVLSTHGISAAPSGLAAAISTGALSAAAIPVATLMAGPFLTMSKLAIGIAGAVVVLLTATWVRQQSEVYVVRAEVAALHDEHAFLAFKLAEMRRGAPGGSNAVPAVARGSSDAVAPSDMTLRWGSAAEIRASLDGLYAPLFRRLKLPPAQVEALKYLLANRRRAVLNVYDVLAAEKIATSELTWNERRQLERVATREIDEQIQTFLGAAEFEYFQSFDRTQQLRSIFSPLVEQLRNSAEPLRDEQIDRLVASTEAGFSSVDGALERGLPILWAHVLHHAHTILSPLQVEKFSQFQKGMEAWQHLIAINRSAEAKGMITPAGHSRAP